MALGPFRELQQPAYVKSAIVGHFKAVRLCRFVAFLFTFALCIITVGLSPLGLGCGVLFCDHGVVMPSSLVYCICRHNTLLSSQCQGVVGALCLEIGQSKKHRHGQTAHPVAIDCESIYLLWDIYPGTIYVYLLYLYGSIYCWEDWELVGDYVGLVGCVIVGTMARCKAQYCPCDSHVDVSVLVPIPDGQSRQILLSAQA